MYIHNLKISHPVACCSLLIWKVHDLKKSFAWRMNYCLDIFVIKSLLMVDTTNLQKKIMKWQKFHSYFNWNIDPVMLSQSAQLTFIRHTYTTHSQQSRIERALGIFINCSQGISHASYTKWSWRPKFPPAELLQLKVSSTAIGGAIYRYRIVHTYRRPKVPAPAIDILG